MLIFIKHNRSRTLYINRFALKTGNYSENGEIHILVDMAVHDVTLFLPCLTSPPNVFTFRISIIFPRFSHYAAECRSFWKIKEKRKIFVSLPHHLQLSQSEQGKIYNQHSSLIVPPSALSKHFEEKLKKIVHQNRNMSELSSEKEKRKYKSIRHSQKSAI